MSPRTIEHLLEAGGTALIIALVVGAFATAGVINMTAAMSMLGLAWVIGTAAMGGSDYFRDQARHWPLTGMIIASLVLAALLSSIGYYIDSVRPKTPPPMVLDTFIQPTGRGVNTGDDARSIINQPPIPVPEPFPLPKAPPSAVIAVLTEPPQSVLKNPDGSQRIFIHVSPDEFKTKFEGLTENQALSLVAPYLMKWIAISGIVHDVKTNKDGTSYVFFVTSTQTILVVAEFDKKWRNNLSILNKGDKLSVACRLSKIQRIDINLDRCEPIPQ